MHGNAYICMRLMQQGKSSKLIIYLIAKFICHPSHHWATLGENLRQLSMPSSPLSAHHHQVTSANSRPPRHCRTSPHNQLTMGTTLCGQPEGEPGGQVSEWVDRPRSDDSSQALPIFTPLATILSSRPPVAGCPCSQSAMWGGPAATWQR